jgi:hypothetical protein
MDERRRDIERAKITAAVKAMREMLDAASEAARALKASEEQTGDVDYCEFDRVVELGHVADVAAHLCRAHLKVLASSAEGQCHHSAASNGHSSMNAGVIRKSGFLKKGPTRVARKALQMPRDPTVRRTQCNTKQSTASSS